jgi:hypothetical protein
MACEAVYPKVDIEKISWGPRVLRLFSLGIRYFAAHDEPQIWYNWRVVIRKEVDYDVNR